MIQHEVVLELLYKPNLYLCNTHASLNNKPVAGVFKKVYSKVWIGRNVY